MGGGASKSNNVKDKRKSRVTVGPTGLLSIEQLKGGRRFSIGTDSVILPVWTTQRLEMIRTHMIGNDAKMATPFGSRMLVYCDYVASGRALSSIEDYIRQQVLPTYANTHTDLSSTGKRTGQLREQARDMVADSCNVDKQSHAVIFTGSGMTGAFDVLLRMLPAPFSLSDEDKPADADRAVVLIGPYEHHSNILPWRHSSAICETVRVDPNSKNGIDLEHLAELLTKYAKNPLIIGSFSVASNVTGVITEPLPVVEMIHKYGGLCIFDYAAGGPYLEIDVKKVGFDAVLISPHKFVGGPGTPGVLIVRRDVDKSKGASNAPPTRCGGGTVEYVSQGFHSYIGDLEAREEAGTPDIVGSIRAGAVFKVKSSVGAENIEKIEDAYMRSVLLTLSRENVPNLCILGDPKARRLPTLSFLIFHDNVVLHHNFVCAIMNDLFGIQSRSGCACAGPYGEYLFGIKPGISKYYMQTLRNGSPLAKPGFTRINIPYFAAIEEVNYILSCVKWIAENGYKLLPLYHTPEGSSSYVYKGTSLDKFGWTDKVHVELTDADFFQPNWSTLVTGKQLVDRDNFMETSASYLAEADEIAARMVAMANDPSSEICKGSAELNIPEDAIWFLQAHQAVAAMQGKGFTPMRQHPIYMPPDYRAYTPEDLAYLDTVAAGCDKDMSKFSSVVCLNEKATPLGG